MGPLEVLVLLIILTPFVLVIRLWTSRRCPKCGKRVTNGKTTCGACGHEFG